MKTRNLFAVLMIGLMMTPGGLAEGDGNAPAPDEGPEPQAAEKSQSQQDSSDPIGKTLAFCVPSISICLDDIICTSNSGSGDSPVEATPNGIGIVVATEPEAEEWYTRWNGYYGGAVLC